LLSIRFQTQEGAYYFTRFALLKDHTKITEQELANCNKSPIFGHLLAIVPEFELFLIRNPARSDIANLRQTGRGVRQGERNG
jgi:hypothetical protein